MADQDKFYNLLIDRFRAFADGHYLIRRFSHTVAQAQDIEQDGEYPYMFVGPVSTSFGDNSLNYQFQVIFVDLPRDKEDSTEYRREIISDTLRLCGDLVAEIKNGQQVFGPEVTILNNEATAEPLIDELPHYLTGHALTFTLQVPNTWDACDIPADWNTFDPSESTPGDSSVGYWRHIAVSGQDTVSADEAADTFNLVGSGVTITTDATTKTITFTVSSSGGVWGSITGTLSNQTDLQTALDGKVDENAAITGATKTKITYDSKGLVTAGADATAADVGADPAGTAAALLTGTITNGDTTHAPTGDAVFDALSSYVPYTGATSDVNLGANDLILTGDVNLGPVDTMTINGGAVDANLIVNNNTSAIQEINTASSSPLGPILYLAKSRGTIASPTVVSNGDILGQISFIGHDGTDFAVGANIIFQVNGTPGNNDMPTQMLLQLTPDGAAVAVTVLTILPTGAATFASTLAASNLSGTNTGDQTSIVGITGTKAEFDTACSDGNFLFVGDVTQYTDEMAQDAVGAMVDSSLVYVDGTPLLTRAAFTGEITAAQGSNTPVLDKTTITNRTAVAAASGDYVLISDVSDSDNLKKVTVQSIINTLPPDRDIPMIHAARMWIY